SFFQFDRISHIYHLNAPFQFLIEATSILTQGDTNGKLYPCAHFMGCSGWEIGHIQTGFNKEKVDKFISLHVDSRSSCQPCWAKYLCGGGVLLSSIFK
ncbi:MAG: SPASM domain-containing protein, partial [candidate division Zixibacteria bacterium]|nr:SPASM domain-containing protein [candidate division Zixibacteria bacterium]